MRKGGQSKEKNRKNGEGLVLAHIGSLRSIFIKRGILNNHRTTTHKIFIL
jgi:hypothetical protein